MMKEQVFISYNHTFKELMLLLLKVLFPIPSYTHGTVLEDMLSMILIVNFTDSHQIHS